MMSMMSPVAGSLRIIFPVTNYSRRDEIVTTVVGQGVEDLNIVGLLLLPRHLLPTLSWLPSSE